MRLAILRVRNEEIIIGSTLNRLKEHFDGAIVFDDASDDYTVDILKADDFVLDVIENNKWESHPKIRHHLETSQRQYLYDYTVQKYNPDWVLYLDADEHLYIEGEIDWNIQSSYYFRLFDVYITPEDEHKHFLDRKWVGSEYRDITMLFRPKQNIQFFNRMPMGVSKSSVFGGYIKHFGKGISVDHWEKSCDYYVNHLYEVGKKGELISEKWKKRKGKAVKKDYLGDFGKPLILWDDRRSDTTYAI